MVFWGTDAGDVELKERELKMHQNFARSMTLAEAMNPNNILCYEMNGAELPAPNGFPLRLIAPGWYGIANVKWLKRIELRDSPFRNKFMARDYVTIREEDHNGETVWVETSVGRSLLKSAPARVTKKDNSYRITGAAWGAPIAKVEVKIDDGPWMEAAIDHSEEAKFAWKIWHLDWEKPAAGEHTVTSRAVDENGQIQPAMDDPWIAKKKTYWESNGQVTRHIKILSEEEGAQRADEGPSSCRRRGIGSDSKLPSSLLLSVITANAILLPSSRRTPGPRLSASTHAESLGPDFRRDDGNWKCVRPTRRFQGINRANPDLNFQSAPVSRHVSIPSTVFPAQSQQALNRDTGTTPGFSHHISW